MKLVSCGATTKMDILPAGVPTFGVESSKHRVNKPVDTERDNKMKTVVQICTRFLLSLYVPCLPI